MSADNCIAILTTRDRLRQVDDHTYRNAGPEGILAYRVAHIGGPDAFETYRKEERHNLGWWMAENFRERPFYDETEALARAREIDAEILFTEYGFVAFDASEYNFPGF